MRRVITIGRELGSGGRTIGKLAASQLGIPYYDRELIDEAANQSGLSCQFIEENEQKSPGSFLYNLVMGNSHGYGLLHDADRQSSPFMEQNYVAQKDVITSFADKGPCVIVGRCADYILRERKDLLRVFIYADLEHRIRRAVREYGLSEKTAKQEIMRSDKARARHYSDFTEQIWGARQNYDCMLNSGVLDFSACADIICSLANRLE